MKKFYFSLVALGMLASGCTFYHVNAEEVGRTSTRSKKSPADIQYLETVTVPYEVLGQVSVETERRNSKEEVIEKMKRDAAMMGGDAITNIVQNDAPSPITRIRTHYTGTVIVFKNNPPPAAETTPAGTTNTNTTENLK